MESNKKRRYSDCDDAASRKTSSAFVDENIPSDDDGDVKEETTKKLIKPLLPPRAPVEGREYIVVKRRAEYWAHFRDYLDEKGMRRSECLYCENKDFASDGNKNGSKNIRNHWLVCPANPDAATNRSKGKQTELIFDMGTSEGEGKLKGWSLNVQEVREVVTYMIIVDELPFRFVQKHGFRRLMNVTCPKFRIPSRYTIARDCFKLYLDEKQKLVEFFKASSQRVSFTTDTWTSIQKMNYMCLTAHFIDDDWKLHKKIIIFCPISSHKGKDIASLLETSFKSWGLEDKVFTLTVDNASSNDTACVELKKLSEKKSNVIGKGKYLHVRCVAHIINLIVWDGLKKNKKSINRVRYAVKYIKSSPSRIQYFKGIASKYTNCKNSLSLDVPTRWNSTFVMLETASKFRDVFGEMNVPNKPNGNEFGPDLDDVDEYGDPIETQVEHTGGPSDSDWTVAESLTVFLKEFKVLTDQVSASLHVTSNSTIFFIGRALDQLNKWSCNEDEDFRHMAREMKTKFDKYWGDVEKMNVLMFVGAILDPHVKLVGLQLLFNRIYAAPKDEELTQQVYRKTSDMFAEYMRLYAPLAPEVDSTNGVSSNVGQGDFMDFKKAIEMQVRMTRSDSGYTKSEFDRYLNEALGAHELDCDILTWWKLNGHRYPVLARMARDVLAIPISTVASESTFSAGRRHLTPFRSSLTPKIVEALLCTQDWIRPKNESELNMEEDLDEIEALETDLMKTKITDGDEGQSRTPDDLNLL